MSDTSTSTSTDSTVSPSASRGTPGCACACWRCPASPRADPASSRATICTPRRAVWSQHGRVRGHGPLRGREDRIPPLLDYSTIFPRWVVCPCSLRDIVRRTLDYYSEFHASMLRITTQKLGLTPELARKPIKICPKCHGEVAPGKHKDCGRACWATNQENLEDILDR